MPRHKTTAQYRKLALAAEDKLQWAKAAKYLELAIKYYPESQKKGALYERDMKNLQRRLRGMKAAAAREKTRK